MKFLFLDNIIQLKKTLSPVEAIARLVEYFKTLPNLLDSIKI